MSEYHGFSSGELFHRAAALSEQAGALRREAESYAHTITELDRWLGDRAQRFKDRCNDQLQAMHNTASNLSRFADHVHTQAELRRREEEEEERLRRLAAMHPHFPTE